MSERQSFTMTQADYDGIIERLQAARNTPLIMLQCGMPPSIQDTANAAWCELGGRLGFDGVTVQPVARGNPLVFTAVPTPAAS